MMAPESPKKETKNNKTKTPVSNHNGRAASDRGSSVPEQETKKDGSTWRGGHLAEEDLSQLNGDTMVKSQSFGNLPSGVTAGPTRGSSWPRPAKEQRQGVALGGHVAPLLRGAGPRYQPSVAGHADLGLGIGGVIPGLLPGSGAGPGASHTANGAGGRLAHRDSREGFNGQRNGTSDRGDGMESYFNEHAPVDILRALTVNDVTQSGGTHSSSGYLGARPKLARAPRAKPLSNVESDASQVINDAAAVEAAGARHVAEDAAYARHVAEDVAGREAAVACHVAMDEGVDVVLPRDDATYVPVAGSYYSAGGRAVTLADYAFDDGLDPGKRAESQDSLFNHCDDNVYQDSLGDPVVDDLGDFIEADMPHNRLSSASSGSASRTSSYEDLPTLVLDDHVRGSNPKQQRLGEERLRAGPRHAMGAEPGGGPRHPACHDQPDEGAHCAAVYPGDGPQAVRPHGNHPTAAPPLDNVCRWRLESDTTEKDSSSPTSLSNFTYRTSTSTSFPSPQLSMSDTSPFLSPDKDPAPPLGADPGPGAPGDGCRARRRSDDTGPASRRPHVGSGSGVTSSLEAPDNSAAGLQVWNNLVPQSEESVARTLLTNANDLQNFNMHMRAPGEGLGTTAADVKVNNCESVDHGESSRLVNVKCQSRLCDICDSNRSCLTPGGGRQWDRPLAGGEGDGAGGGLPPQNNLNPGCDRCPGASLASHRHDASASASASASAFALPYRSKLMNVTRQSSTSGFDLDENSFQDSPHPGRGAGVAEPPDAPAAAPPLAGRDRCSHPGDATASAAPRDDAGHVPNHVAERTARGALLLPREPCRRCGALNGIIGAKPGGAQPPLEDTTANTIGFLNEILPGRLRNDLSICVCQREADRDPDVKDFNHFHVNGTRHERLAERDCEANNLRDSDAVEVGLGSLQPACNDRFPADTEDIPLPPLTPILSRQWLKKIAKYWDDEFLQVLATGEGSDSDSGSGEEGEGEDGTGCKKVKRRSLAGISKAFSNQSKEERMMLYSVFLRDYVFENLKYEHKTHWFLPSPDDQQGVEKVLLWTEYQAYVLQVSQIAASACGATAAINVLKYFDIYIDQDKVCEAIPTNLRAENASVSEYLFSRSVAGVTAHQLIDGISKVTDGAIYGRFFHLFPEREIHIRKWLAHWMKQGAVPVVTLNRQRAVPRGWVVPDAWHHQMVYGVGPKGVYLTNPQEIIPEYVIQEQLCSESVLLVRRKDVVSRWDANCNLGLILSHPDGRWLSMNVLGQVVNVLREENMPHMTGFPPQLTSQVRIPAWYQSGISLFARRDSDVGRQLEAAQELNLNGEPEAGTRPDVQ